MPRRTNKEIPASTRAIIAGIKARMTAKGWDRVTLSKNSLIGGTYVSELLRGLIPNPGSIRLLQIAAALECTVAELSELPPVADKAEDDGDLSDISDETAVFVLLNSMPPEMRSAWIELLKVTARFLGRKQPDAA